MLGVYSNFPKTFHRAIRFASPASTKKLQLALTETLRKMNQTMFSLEAITDPSILDCTVCLEFGIAEDNDFNYLNDEECSRLAKIVQENALQLIDSLCVVRYQKTCKEKKASLRSDYYMLRFAFREGFLEMYIYHEKGPRYASPEDVVNFVANKINEETGRKTLKIVTES